MAVPDYQTLMLPLLKLASDGKTRTIREAVDGLAEQFQVTEGELKQLLPSGRQRTFDNRVGWARTYLKKAGLVDSPQRGRYQITDRGRSILAQNPPRINVAFLSQFPEFLKFRDSSHIEVEEIPQRSSPGSNETPEEAVASGYLNLRRQVESELLDRIKAAPPDFFERLVVTLLIAIGYGGSLADAGKAIGKSGDGGIDGVIKEDKLGLDLLYIQAKRWEDAVVGRPDIQRFVGALHGKRSKKGIFITTSTFSRDAREYADGVETKVVLIDGPQLAELMFDYGIGVATLEHYVIKRIDSDFFEEDTNL